VFVRGIGVLIDDVAVVVVARQHVADAVVGPTVRIDVWNGRIFQTIQVIITERGCLCGERIRNRQHVSQVVMRVTGTKVLTAYQIPGFCYSLGRSRTLPFSISK